MEVITNILLVGQQIVSRNNHKLDGVVPFITDLPQLVATPFYMYEGFPVINP